MPPRRLRPRLITPHGDRKRAPVRRPSLYRQASHYPSWGSETTVIGSAPQPGVDRLITPHGDRKRAQTAGTPATGQLVRPARLITPHGDRKNPTLAGRRRLITPHGDRKPDWRPGGHSLPLMGIGNLKRLRVRAQRDRELITPHGDRKRRRSCRVPAGAGAHYPSWGSETLHTGRADPPGHYPHYPSWGSETRRRRRFAVVSLPHDVVSLPLMGIGNALMRCRVRAQLRELITPHGDRKPYLDRI